MTKKWHQSKTVWFNLLSAAVFLSTELDAVLVLYPGPDATVDLIRAWLPFVSAVGNLWLRSVTRTAVTL